MIIRIMGEGQYDVAAADIDGLNALDSQLEQAVESGETDAFATAFASLLEGVRKAGSPVAEDSLDESDLILPPADAGIDEVRELLSGDGLIPG